MNVKYFNASGTSEWDTSNLRMQSVLNNYALSVSDRLNIYKHVRTEGAAGDGSFLYQLVRLATGTGADGPPATAQAPAARAGGARTHRPAGAGAYARMPKSESSSSLDEAGAGAEEGQETVKLSPTHRAGKGGEQALGPGTAVDEDDDEDADERKHQAPLPGTPKVTATGTKDTSVPLTEAYMEGLVDEVEVSESGFSPTPLYHLDPSFAQGQVTTSSFMHSLLCHSYFRPFVIDVVRGLCSTLRHLPIPGRFVGRSYGRLVRWALSEGRVPLGLFRHGAGTGGVAAAATAAAGTTNPAPLPYVYTNPASTAVVGELDILFAL